MMPEMHISITALQRGDEYIMHLRNGDRRRGAVGLIGFFGGQIEKGESHRQAARRELRQETNLNLPDSEFELLGDVDVESDRDDQPVLIMAAVFKVALPIETVVVAKEKRDKLVAATTQEVISSYVGKHRLTPATEKAFTSLILKDASTWH